MASSDSRPLYTHSESTSGSLKTQTHHRQTPSQTFHSFRFPSSHASNQGIGLGTRRKPTLRWVENLPRPDRASPKPCYYGNFPLSPPPIPRVRTETRRGGTSSISLSDTDNNVIESYGPGHWYWNRRDSESVEDEDGSDSWGPGLSSSYPKSPTYGPPKTTMTTSTSRSRRLLMYIAWLGLGVVLLVMLVALSSYTIIG